MRASWTWLSDAAARSASTSEAAVAAASMSSWRTLDDVLAAIAREDAENWRALRAPRRPQASEFMEWVCRGRHIAISGRTAIVADVNSARTQAPERPELTTCIFNGRPRGPNARAVAPLVYLAGLAFTTSSASPWSEKSRDRCAKHGAVLDDCSITPMQNRANLQTFPSSRTPPSEHLRVVPLEHIFGSEPMSAAAPAVAQLVPAPYVLMNDVDALAQGIRANND